MDVSRKRPRSANWDDREKMTFVNIVMNHLIVIEDKHKTIISNKKKDEAWQEIQKYMEQLGYKRDAYRLREQWLRMKAQAKKAIKTFHQEVGDNNKTCSVPPPTAIDYMIRDMVPHEFVEDDDNPDDPEKVPSAEVWTAQNLSPEITNSEQSISESPAEAHKFCEVIGSDIEKVEATGVTNDGETTDTAEGSDCPPKKNSREEFNKNSDGPARNHRPRSSQRQMTSFERATLELQRAKTEAAMRQEAELHRVKMEAALWERRFWEAKLLRVRGYRL